MKPFLRQVAEQILRDHPGHTSEVMVVFNNHRSELFLRQRFKELSTETGQTFFLPQTMVIDDLVRQMGGLEIVQPEFLLFELYRIHCELEGDNRKYQTFEEFIPFGDMMLSDFSEVDRYMVDAHDLFVNLHDLKAIGEWDIENPHMSEFQRSYLRFYHSLYEYYTRLRERLAARGQAYAGMAYRAVAERLMSGERRVESGERGVENGERRTEREAAAPGCSPLSTLHSPLNTYFVGFNAMSECERKIIGAFVHSGHGHLLTDGDAYYYDDPNQEAGYFLRKHSAEFDELGHYGPSLFATGKKKITIVECPENVLQCKFAGQILSASPPAPLRCGEGSDNLPVHQHSTPLSTMERGEGVRLEDTAIVLADEKLLIPTLASLPDGDYHVNVTMGFAYSDSHLHSLACKVLELHRRRNARGYYHVDVLEVLSDHFVNGQWTMDDGQPVSRTDIASFLKERNMVRVTAAEVAERFPEAAYLFPDEQLSPDGSIALLREMTSRLLATERLDTNPKERQAAGALAEVTDYLTSLQRDYGFMQNIESLSTIYSRIAQRHTIAFIGQPLSGLQLLGMLETRNLDFRRIILLSAGEGVLPAARSAATLIPHELKRAFHLPTYEERDSVYAYNFYRLLQRAEEVYLVYSSDAESAGKGEESRLLRQVRSELARRFPNIEVTDMVLDSNQVSGQCSTTNGQSADAPENHEVQSPNPELKKASMSRLNDIATGRGFSPTALSRYLECPLKYFYVSIMGLHEQETLDDDLDASQLGETVHNVLRDIYLPFVGRCVDAAALREAKANLESLLDNEMQTLMSGGRNSEGRNSFLRSVALTQLGRLLDREAKVIDDGHRLEVVALEQDYRCEVSGGQWSVVSGQCSVVSGQFPGTATDTAPMTNGHQLPTTYISGRVDRIDRLDGRLRIIDYKTGSLHSDEIAYSSGKTMPGKWLQLMAYALMYAKSGQWAEPTLTVGIYPLRYLKSGVQLATWDKSDTVDAKMLDNFETILCDILATLLDPSQPFSPTPSTTACRFCPAATFCPALR